MNEQLFTLIQGRFFNGIDIFIKVCQNIMLLWFFRNAGKIAVGRAHEMG